ncbi:MAG TPA: DnaA/Hda family protein [Burkholderiales bacterium]|nr:DnaA/Hda family protein [Burkholderiales bacterium]
MLESKFYMRQLPLEISSPAAPSLDNFVAGDNAEALARVRELVAGRLREAIVYLWGDAGSGRTHLLRAAQSGNASLVIADDVERLDPDEQQRLFIAINDARDGRGAVLAAGSAPPAALALRDDLRSRLAWGLVYHLKPLAEAEKLRHLQNEARRRGLALSDEIAAYLLARVPRDMATLAAVLEALDRQAMARQRPLTLPLVREVLGASNDKG